MRRYVLTALVVACLPFLAHAQTKKTDIKKASGEVRAIPTVAPGEAKPASFTSAPRPVPIADNVAMPVGPVQTAPMTFGERLRAAYYLHVCAPDGCPKPIGCGNFWTEKKFIFGSCRQFFGTAESSVGHHRGTVVP